MKQRRNPWVRGIAALSALLVFTAAGCGKTEEPASDVSGERIGFRRIDHGNEMTSSATEDNTMTTTTQDGTTTTADTAGTHHNPARGHGCPGCGSGGQRRF